MQLEICGYFLYDKLSFNLPKLQVLAIHHFNQAPLSIDCPALRVLVYHEHEYIEKGSLLNLKHPETIQQLETCMVGSKLSSFKNVVCLITGKFEAVSKETLLLLPKLKELRYNEDINFAYLEPNVSFSSVNELKQELRQFMDHVEVSRASDFKFRFAGFQLNMATLDQIDFDVQIEGGQERIYPEYVYIRNYRLIEPDAILNFIWHLDYTRLMNYGAGEIPPCFFKKFISVETVDVGAVQNEKHLLWFLRSLRSFRILNLMQSELSQEFFDQLPASAHSLTDLVIRGDEKNELQMSFDFAAELPHLSLLEINRNVSFKTLKNSLARWLGKLTHVSIKFQMYENYSYIKKSKGSNECYVTHLKRNPLYTENPDEVVSFFEEIQKEKEHETNWFRNFRNEKTA